MDNLNGHVMNLANSIIGVSVLAMPYCFKQCGIILSVLMLLISSIISRLACHFLLKSAIISRRKTFEFLAFHIFGSMGKLAVEVGMIGFLLGTCIAFFVVMGDLAPEIIAELSNSHTTSTLRTSILIALALFVVLPLGLLRNVDSLNGVSKATIGFYFCLVLKVLFEALPHLFSGDWYSKINLWRPEGLLQCLPIFSMALFCQSQLFEIFHAVPNATLDKMNNLVRIAVNICTMVYISVGVFGCIAFCSKPFIGNVLLSFSPSLITDIMKIGFTLSVAFSFPLVIFPCRASLHSLLYKTGYSLHEGVSDYIPEERFRVLTVVIIFVSLIIGIMIPNIELVLGLVGSTIGIMICVLFPVTCFICISPKNTNEKSLAQIMLFVGIIVMVLGTYKNLYAEDTWKPSSIITKTVTNNVNVHQNVAVMEKLPTTIEAEIAIKVTDENTIKEIRHEPPQPIEPVEENVKNEHSKNIEKTIIQDLIKPSQNETKIEEVDIEAIKKEDKEEQLQKKEFPNDDQAHRILIDTIQRQNEVQKEIVEQQKKLIEVILSQQKKEGEKVDITEEKLKAVKNIESYALKAMEEISGGENSKTIDRELKKSIEKNEAVPKMQPLNSEVHQQNIKQSEDKNENLNSVLASNSRTNLEIENIPEQIDLKNNSNSNSFPLKPENKSVVKTEKEAEVVLIQEAKSIKATPGSNANIELNSNQLLPADGELAVMEKHNEMKKIAPLFLNLGKFKGQINKENISKQDSFIKIENNSIPRNLSVENLDIGPDLKKDDQKNGEINDDMQAIRAEIL